MTAREVARRLEATAAGRPLPSGTTRHLCVTKDQDLLAVAFVRMGGESLPWAVGFRYPATSPTVFAVPDARDRDRVAEMLVGLTPHVAQHLDHPQWSDGTVTSDSPVDAVPLRQIWMPNGSHAQLLHMLNLRYTFARAGEATRAATLRALGRLSGFLFREAARPGQATIIDASAALREAFTFPADDLRQQHLGLLLAMLADYENEEDRAAAEEAAERHSISASLDPAIERDELERAVDGYNVARREDERKTMSSCERSIEAVLKREVQRRLALTVSAAAILKSDPRPVNRGATELAQASTKARQRDFLWLEERLAQSGEDNGFFPPSPETDRDRRTAASRYLHLSSADQEVAATLIHDDPELQEDAIAAGDALRGKVIRVEDRAAAGSRGMIPVWTVEGPSSTPTRLRRGSKICVGGMPKRTGTVLGVGISGPVRRIEVEIDGWKRKPNPAQYPEYADALAANDVGYEDSSILLISSGLGGIGARKSKRVYDDSGVGAWLTHGRGQAPDGTRRGRGHHPDVLAEVEGLRFS